MSAKSVVITYNSQSGETTSLAARICVLLRQSGITPLVYANERDEVIGADCADSTRCRECICMIAVGGDGTILHWGKLAAMMGLPLLGVNRGRLGFMATLEPSDIEMIPQMILGEFTTSCRMIMNVEIHRADGSCETREALNDVVVERDRASKLPEFRISCGDSEVSRLQADGVIFSTPTGSTAYALSAGGAIIAPDMECIECTPLCPHTLFSRPMIFSVTRDISLKCSSYQGSVVTLSVDSERGIPFGEGDTLLLSRFDTPLLLIEAGEGFFGAVRNKLMTPLK